MSRDRESVLDAPRLPVPTVRRGPTPGVRGGREDQRQGRMRKALLGLLPILTLVILVCIWEVVAVVGHMKPYLLPRPLEVARAIGTYHSVLLSALWHTLIRVLFGFAISAAAGVVIGVFVAFSKILERMVYPILVAFQAVPTIALAPLLLIWLGYGNSMKVSMAALVGFFPMVLQSVLGMREISEDMVNMARVTGAPAGRIFRIVRFPNALPALFTGVKMCITLSVIGVIIGEFVASTPGGSGGLGYIISSAEGRLQTDLAFAAIAILAALSLAIFYVATWLEKKLVRR